MHGLFDKAGRRMGKYSRNVSFQSKAAYIDEPGVRRQESDQNIK